MEIVPICPLRTGSLLWQALPGAWVLTVVCKATYVLAPTEAPLAAEQEEPNEDDTYWDDDPARSLHSASDLVPFKVRADVLLVGHAFAPGERPVRSLVARMLVGDVDKSIEAVCDRSFSLDGKLREGSPFARMSLGYERALGGPGTTNPVGIRRDARDAYGTSPVPNLQPAGVVVTSPSDSFDPIGFGPIAPIWPSRREKLGRHAGVSSPRALLAGPLPEDIDRTFWNAAPLDQQLSVLRNNERIILENLHPKHPRLVTSLPGIAPRAFIEGRPSGILDLPMVPDTLFIDTDRALCSVTWRGSFQLEHAHERGRVIVGMEQPGKPLTRADAERILASQEKSGSGGPGARPRRPNIEIAHAREAVSDSTNTYVEPKEPTVRGTALPFGLRSPSDQGESAGLGATMLSSQPALSTALAQKAPPKAPRPSIPDEEDDDSDNPFSDSTSTFVDVSGQAADIKLTGSTLPFASPRGTERSEPAPPPRSSALPFVAPAQPPRPGGGPPAPPASPSPASPPPLPSSLSAPSPSPSPASSTPAPPPLYIAESGGQWGAAQPPPLVGTTPSGGVPGSEGAVPWVSSPPGAAAPPAPMSSRAPAFRPPLPSSAALPPPRAESLWASGAPPMPSMASSPSMPSMASMASMPSMPSIAIAPPLPGAPSPEGAEASSDAAVLAASNAAAARSAPWDKFRAAEAAPVEEEIVPESEPEARAEARDIVEMIWFDMESVPRMRRQPSWRTVLDDLENRAPDADIEETTLTRTAAQAEDHRDVFEILARGSTAEGNNLNDALDKAIREDGKYVPPLSLVLGDLVFPFDEAETLRAYVAAATPLASTDEHMRSSISLAKEFLSAPGLAGAPGVAEGLIARMKEAFSMAKRPVPADYLDTQTSRALLEKRCYQRRDLFGGTYLRCLFHTAAVTGVSAANLANAPGPGAPSPAPGSTVGPSVAGASTAAANANANAAAGAVPTYLPESLAKKLPLFQRFRVRMIGEVHLAVDQIETHPLALKAVALARSVERPVRK